MFDVIHTTRVSYTTGINPNLYSTKHISNSLTCIHEDGGIYAVYTRHQQVIYKYHFFNLILFIIILIVILILILIIFEFNLQI